MVALKEITRDYPKGHLKDLLLAAATVASKATTRDYQKVYLKDLLMAAVTLALRVIQRV